MNKIVVLAAHYDDAEIGCAGTLYEHSKKGDEIHLIIFNPENERSGSSEVRLIEQQTSLNKLNIPLKNLHLIDSLDDDSLFGITVSKIDEYKADIIFLPYWDDTHQQHRKVSELGQAALRKRNITGLFYFSGSSINFQPNIFNLIDPNIKSSILNSFSSQLKNGSLNKNLITDYCKYCGSIISDHPFSYAEGFYCRRMRYPL